ncbi:MAG: Gfo/Idh/MocA family oxidoreductase [Candidatus Brocadiae bacterium]|nr:Gfo/Idh/MocA family oxidoreductase [Candidatus Brocadiia bacterium]
MGDGGGEGKTVRVGVIGLGWGAEHAKEFAAREGVELAAVAEPDEAIRAKQLPKIAALPRVYDDGLEMIRSEKLDIVDVTSPDWMHAEHTIACLKAGKHVVSEKPFCITTDEATKMIRAAQRAKVMLSVFHNRRWDGDYRAIRDIIARGLLGDVYHIECFSGSYDRPGTWWRSDKTISGGALYDWGAHFTDWILRLVDKRVTQVTGFFHKRLWHHVTSEDATQAIVRFEDGTMADLQQSNLAAVGKPMWRILGTLGGLVANGKDTVDVTSYASGVKFEGKIPAKSSYGSVEYYRNVADHLLLGEPLLSHADQAREVIAVIETAERSSAEGRSLPLPAEVYED